MFCAVAQMIQLTFQPAYDPFHAMFRFLRLKEILSQKSLHRDHVRILDFYLMFPFRIAGIRLTPQHQTFRRLTREYTKMKPYGNQPEDRIVFNRMEQIQIAALETLAAREFIDASRLQVGEVAITKKPLPLPLATRISDVNDEDRSLFSFLEILAFDYPLTGANGLKDRTHLADFRHDAI
jgi:hypothetical protein